MRAHGPCFRSARVCGDCAACVTGTECGSRIKTARARSEASGLWVASGVGVGGAAEVGKGATVAAEASGVGAGWAPSACSARQE